MNTDPVIAQRNLTKYLGKGSVLLPSSMKNKKYMVQTPSGSYVSFGDKRYADFTFHNNIDRQRRYLARASKIKGDWKSDPYSPNNLAMNVLWM
jgi:hypothetical protein